MAVKFVFDSPLLRAWLLLHQTYNLMLKAEDIVFARVGLTTQQHAVLMAMKFIRSPVTASDIALWLDRNINTITTLADRMEKDGLIIRERDLKDRRSVRLVMTRKGKKALEHATVIAWPLVQNILNRLSEEEMRELNILLETIREGAFAYINPDKTMKEVKINGESKRMARFPPHSLK
jgi:DNA-binding MarR family transcriptional regulator